MKEDILSEQSASDLSKDSFSQKTKPVFSNWLENPNLSAPQNSQNSADNIISESQPVASVASSSSIGQKQVVVRAVNREKIPFWLLSAVILAFIVFLAMTMLLFSTISGKNLSFYLPFIFPSPTAVLQPPNNSANQITEAPSKILNPAVTEEMDLNIEQVSDSDEVSDLTQELESTDISSIEDDLNFLDQEDINP